MAIDRITELLDTTRLAVPPVEPVHPAAGIHQIPQATSGMQLSAPFALVICPRKDASFCEHIGWHVAEAVIWCEQPGGRVLLEDEVAAFLPCQGEAEWPSGSIDLGGTPW